MVQSPLLMIRISLTAVRGYVILRFVTTAPSWRHAKISCDVGEADIYHMDQPVTITGKFPSIMWTTVDAFKIDFAVTTPL